MEPHLQQVDLDAEVPFVQKWDHIAVQLAQQKEVIASKDSITGCSVTTELFVASTLSPYDEDGSEYRSLIAHVSENCRSLADGLEWFRSCDNIDSSGILRT